MSFSHLTPDQIDALKIIAEKKQIPIPKSDIEALLKHSYIANAYGGGWLINSKGRKLLKDIKKLSQGKGEVSDIRK